MHGVLQTSDRRVVEQGTAVAAAVRAFARSAVGGLTRRRAARGPPPALTSLPCPRSFAHACASDCQLALARLPPCTAARLDAGNPTHRLSLHGRLFDRGDVAFDVCSRGRLPAAAPVGVGGAAL